VRTGPRVVKSLLHFKGGGMMRKRTKQLVYFVVLTFPAASPLAESCIRFKTFCWC